MAYFFGAESPIVKRACGGVRSADGMSGAVGKLGLATL